MGIRLKKQQEPKLLCLVPERQGCNQFSLITNLSSSVSTSSARSIARTSCATSRSSGKALPNPLGKVISRSICSIAKGRGLFIVNRFYEICYDNGYYVKKEKQLRRVVLLNEEGYAFFISRS